MAYHHPVISTPVGGIPEILRNGYNGTLVQPGDTEGIANAIQHYIVNRETIKSEGEQSYKIVQSFFPENVFTTLKGIYNKLLV